MCERAVYLRKAIDLYVKEQYYFQLEVSQSEWKRIEFLLDVLEPFKRCNDRMEATTRPGIEKVFWIYETLFNELDRIVETMDKAVGEEAGWIEELEPAFGAMRAKLTKYYTGTSKPFVYGDGMILDPRLKLHLTKRPEWSGGQEGEFSGEAYSAACRKRYVENYQKSTHPSHNLPTILKKHANTSMDDDDFEQMLISLPSDSQVNQYDAYINAPRIKERGNVLDIWRIFGRTEYPDLAMMVRDVFAVPATGAGVEWQFSKSGKVETKLRARIEPTTTSESMMYTDLLKRKRRPLTMNHVTMGIGECEVDLNDENPPVEWRQDWFRSCTNKKGM